MAALRFVRSVSEVLNADSIISVLKEHEVLISFQKESGLEPRYIFLRKLSEILQ